MICNTCGCPGAELLLQRQRCVNRRCFNFEQAHFRRFERAWSAEAHFFVGDKVGQIVDWLVSGGKPQETAW